jgi:CRISPR-associated endonuclease Csn1
MQSKHNFGKLTFGFDIGIASVGWAVLNEKRIVDLGVRCFDKAETAKEGESLNLARRNARLLRRRLRRRAWRLTKLARLLKLEGLINDINVLKQPPSKGAATPNLWQLRVDGLNRKLSSEEWARVIYHLCKHRGFHWVSKAEKLKADGDAVGETGKVKKGLAATNALIREKGYRSAAEMVLAEFPDAQRNKQGEYSKALERELLDGEFKKLFEVQRSLDNPHTSQALEEKLLDRKTGLFWAQKPSLSGEALLKMLGKCTFEKSEFRAPKASFTAERHVWLTRLNNLRLVVDGTMRPLTEDERRLVIDLPYNQAGYLKYKQLKSVLIKQAGLPETTRFTGLSYPSTSQLESGKLKDPEDNVVVKVPAFQELRKTLKDGLETEWQGLINAAMAGDASLLDQMAWVLSIYKEDDEVERELNKLNLPSKAKMVDALLGVRFDKFSNLSLKALYKIVPVMEQGKRYDEACLEAGYHHSQLDKADDIKQEYLPPFYSARDNTGKLIFNESLDIPRNPVVLRALNQVRKVCNALIKKYGSPYQVNIEMARDLSKPFDERRKIQTEQEAFRDRNQAMRKTFNETFNTTGELKGRDFEKWQLYEEQQGKCAYSLQPLDVHRLFDLGYVEIDHALPYSRSFDDSKNNRVLVLANENRNKGNQTPYEYLDGKSNSPRWHEFTVWVNSNKAYRQAKRNRLLKKEFGEKDAQEFRDRNLNDTRYICRFFKNYVEQYLQLHEESEAKRCVVLSGQMTSFLRNRWGLSKVRSDSDRHHALDAVVVAAATHGMVKRLSDYARRKELAKVSQGFVDVTTGEVPDIAMFNQLNEHFPSPWENFRHELEARLKQDDIEQLRNHCEKLDSYTADDLAQIKPLFVSRAPQRRNSGAAHKETIYGKPKAQQVLLVADKEAQKQSGADKVTRVATIKEKSELAIQTLGVMDKDTSGNYKFTFDKLDALVDLHRNQWMINALRIWLKDRDVRDKRAKEIENSLGKGKSKRDLSEEEKQELLYLRGLPRKPTKADPENGPFTGPIIRSVKVNMGKTSGITIRNGIAENASGSMLRIDVFKKDGKFHLIPVYVHHQVSKELPQYAIVANKNEDEWTLIDHTYDFCFSVYPNDLVKITQRSGETIFGYYRSCHSGTAALSIALHDRYAYGEKTTSLSLFKKNPNKALPNDKLGLIESVGVKIAANFEKFNVDVLGNIYPVQKETRGLA